MRTEPTEQENRLAIDALKAEEKPEFTLKNARAGLQMAGEKTCYVVVADSGIFEYHIASFHFNNNVDSNSQNWARFLADKLAREINAGVYDGT